MSLVSLGEHSKFTASPTERDRIRGFYGGVLECEAVTQSDRIDVFKLGDWFQIGFLYGVDALSPAQAMKSIWLELRTVDPARLKQKILDFGIAEIDYVDKEHFYFQAPGGQVFRLAGLA